MKRNLGLIYKNMISRKIAERHLNITGSLNNFKSFIKPVYQKKKERKKTQNIIKKRDQNNYLRAEIT